MSRLIVTRNKRSDEIIVFSQDSLFQVNIEDGSVDIVDRHIPERRLHMAIHRLMYLQEVINKALKEIADPGTRS